MSSGYSTASLATSSERPSECGGSTWGESRGEVRHLAPWNHPAQSEYHLTSRLAIFSERDTVASQLILAGIQFCLLSFWSWSRHEQEPWRPLDEGLKMTCGDRWHETDPLRDARAALVQVQPVAGVATWIEAGGVTEM